MTAAVDDPAQPSDSATGFVDAEPPGPAGSSRNRVAIVLSALLVLVSVLGLVVERHQLAAATDRTSDATAAESPPRATGIPPAVPTSIATLMGLSPVPATGAPSFTLVDQNGDSMSLAALRGHPVVLEFMDPACVDICPIVSQEFVDAYRDLGTGGKSVVFLGVNVNAYHTDVAAMKTYSDAHNLRSVASWHFLTGPVGALQKVWHDYGVEVSAPSPTADVIHTSVVYFIDASGQERYVAFPMADHAADGSSYLPAGQTASWGKGIALVADSLR